MKLKEWAEKTGIKYLTAYRWFRAGTLPVKAYQTESGTIIVDDEDAVVSNQLADVKDEADAASLFLKKTLEFSKNNSPLEDFAAYIFSNFNLSLKEKEDKPRYSKNKPKPEDIQNHFKRFLPVQGEKPKPNMYIPEPEFLDELAPKEEPTALVMSGSPTVSEEINSLQSNYSTLLSNVGSSYDASSVPLAPGAGVSFYRAPDEELGGLSFSNNQLDISSNVMCSVNGASPTAGIFYTNNYVESQALNLDKPKRGRPKKVRE